jgi:hypothetical protein
MTEPQGPAEPTADPQGLGESKSDQNPPASAKLPAKAAKKAPPARIAKKAPAKPARKAPAKAAKKAAPPKAPAAKAPSAPSALESRPAVPAIEPPPVRAALTSGVGSAQVPPTVGVAAQHGRTPWRRGLTIALAALVAVLLLRRLRRD